MDAKLRNLILLITGVLLVVGGLLYWMWVQEQAPGKFDQFAQCLKDKGAVFYGAFWCSHCQAQKKLFGNSAKHLPYVECSTPDGKGQLQVCTDQKVEGYPTWKFADASEHASGLTLRELSEKTGCVLP